MFNFTYKCRLCGATFSKSGTSNEQAAMDAMILAALGRDEGERMVRVHPCKPKDYGIADLIGAKFTPDK
jgi:hypothetical protein